MPSRLRLPFCACCAAAALLAGCASFVNDDTHPLRIELAQADGRLVDGAPCTLIRGAQQIQVWSGETMPALRGRDDIHVTCRANGQSEATGTLISRANVGLAGNIFFGGGVGAIVDHSNARAYTYPTWVRLVVGETRVYDRRDEVDGQPLLGQPPTPNKP
ncbi:MAG: hypothetical protein KF871_18345 [Hydrogenophaga sp.]|uniref:hypothetical protein n=1 Tax=Hydrogenophaga sp. TaxID=1904254 RepID=UPI001D2D5F44|nr:hypothetical protein [Hydrogenophaga sp.]MBX3611858.1 hypothetical protein [Hydrogenophaga sp.]